MQAVDEKREARIAIAKDALKWLELKALIPSHFYIEPLRSRWHVGLEPNQQVRNVVVGRCRVCALGAMMVAKVIRFDACTVEQFKSEVPYAHLSPYFADSTLRAIECAYEGWRRVVDGLPWVARFPNDRRRMKAILENIIRNGDFAMDDIGDPS
jgi:hypothetical protein